MFFHGPETEKPADVPGTCRAAVRAGPGNTAGSPRTQQGRSGLSDHTVRTWALRRSRRRVRPRLHVCRVLSHFSCVRLCSPMDRGPPGSSVHGISQQEYWSGLPFPPPGDLANSGIEPRSLMSPALADRLFTAEPSEKPGIDIHTICYLKINKLIMTYCIAQETLVSNL